MGSCRNQTSCQCLCMCRLRPSSRKRWRKSELFLTIDAWIIHLCTYIHPVNKIDKKELDIVAQSTGYYYRISQDFTGYRDWMLFCLLLELIRGRCYIVGCISSVLVFWYVNAEPWINALLLYGGRNVMLLPDYWIIWSTLSTRLWS